MTSSEAMRPILPKIALAVWQKAANGKITNSTFKTQIGCQP